MAGATDYYPFGMVMPGRSLQSDYRYAYQGQEKDPETGKEAFQLRLWDSRIGRWLTTDPAGQYSSPYLGMGNDPINGIDPDGGWRFKLFAKWARNNAIKAGMEVGELTKVGKEWGFNTFSEEGMFNTQTGGFDYGIEGTFNFTNAWKDNIPAQINATSLLTNFDFWRNSVPDTKMEALGQIGVELTYGSFENVYSMFSGGRKLNGTQLSGDHRTNAGVDGFVTAVTAGFGYTVKSGFKALKSSPKLFNAFAQETKGLFKGSNHALLRSQAYKQMLKNHTKSVQKINSNMRKTFDVFDDYSTNMGRLEEIYNQSTKDN